MSGVQAVAREIPRASAVSLLLAGSLCLLPFLLPYHQLPILSFSAEWLAAALGTAAMLASLGGRGGAFVSVPLLARWLMAFALFLAAQTLVGMPAYPQLPMLGSLYILYAALLIWLGAQLAASAGFERAATVLAACLLAGALANAAAGMIQFYGRPTLLEDFVAELRRGSGAYGNIAQSNLYANYLALGGTALLFLWLRRLRTAYALAAALLLAWAGALSGSRGALLYALWFAALVLAGADAGRRRIAATEIRAHGLAGMMLAAHVAIPWLNDGARSRSGPRARAHSNRWSRYRAAHEKRAGRPGCWPCASSPMRRSRRRRGRVCRRGIRHWASPGNGRGGEVWTSPQNLPLHLLAETGALGAFLALAGLAYLVLARRAALFRRAAAGNLVDHRRGGNRIDSFDVRVPAVERDIFLGVTALLLGRARSATARAGAASRLNRTLAAGHAWASRFSLATSLKTTCASMRARHRHLDDACQRRR